MFLGCTRGWLGRTLVATLAVALWPLGSAPAVDAHAVYVRSEPPTGGQLYPPFRITVYFSEELDTGVSELQVLDAALRRVDRRDTLPVPSDPRALTVSVPDLPDGTYTVAWKTLSAIDGHTVKGAFPLVVGKGGGGGAVSVIEVPPAPFEVVLRGLIFFGSLVLFGGFVFGSVVLGPALGGGARRWAGVADVGPRWQLRFRRLALVLASALLAVGAAWIGYQAVVVSDVSPWEVLGEPLMRYLRTRGGAIWEIKLVLLALLVAGLLRLSWRWLAPIGLLLLGGFLLTTSLTSHAAALQRGAELAVLADLLHQAGAGAWLGSLVAALLLMPEVFGSRPEVRQALLAAVVPRLSAVALASVGVLVATGAFGALVQVGAPQAVATVYGTSLLVKIGALVPMLGLGAVNLLMFKPRFVAAGQSLMARSDQVLALTRRFRWAVAGEVFLGIVIVSATGILTTAEPAREVWQREPKPVDLSTTAEDLRVRLRIEPGRVGPNTVTTEVRDQGRAAAAVQRVQLRFTYLDQSLGRGTRIADRQAEGIYGVESNDLSAAGRWQVDVAVRRLDREDAIAPFLMDIGVPTGPNNGSAIALPAFRGSHAPWGFALLLAGLLGLLWTLLSSGLRGARRPGLALFCSLVALMSVGLVASAADFSPDLATLRNPIPITERSLSRGREMYFSTDCPMCHGENGRGDGPLAVGLRPPPADFRIHMAAGHTDGQIFDWISNGVQGTVMPTYRDTLSEEERWYLITFIRSFAGEE